MDLDPNFSEFIGLLLDHDVKFLVVGGYAVAAHGHPRYTGDLDVWILTDVQNAQRLLQALEAFGFGEVGLTLQDFTTPDRVVQLGYPPLRIDLLTSLDGVTFADCYERRMDIALAGMRVAFIGLDDLLHNKRAAGRAQDQADVAALEAGPRHSR